MKEKSHPHKKKKPQIKKGELRPETHSEEHVHHEHVVEDGTYHGAHHKHETPRRIHEHLGVRSQSLTSFTHDSDLPWRADLDPQAGKEKGEEKILFLDAFSGLAGDMCISALVDLGVPKSVVEQAVSSLGMKGFHMHFTRESKHGLVGTKFCVHVEEDHPVRAYSEICHIISTSKLDDSVKRRALATFRILAESEAKVHHTSIEQVHFHEVGAVDAIVDIVGASAAFDYLGAEVFVSPLPMGRGFVKSAHGNIPLPAPAVMECLKGFELKSESTPFEFVTPTGASLMAAQAKSLSCIPNMKVERLGFGAGEANLSDRPNLLRAVFGFGSMPKSKTEFGSTPTLEGRQRGEKNGVSYIDHKYRVMETNIDDASPELLAHASTRLLMAGALDVWTTPVVMKKGRMGVLLSVLCNIKNEVDLVKLMFEETPSFGLRVYSVSRYEKARKMVDVTTPYGVVPFKVSGDRGELGYVAKPEFSVCQKLAEERGISLKQVTEQAIFAWLKDEQEKSQKR